MKPCSRPPPARRLQGATLFSGIGAAELAAPEIDWIWTAEIDKAANAVRSMRWPDLLNLGDVQEIADSDRLPPSVDILVLSPPCQSFSFAGRRRGLSDPRGALLADAARVLARLQPRWFLLENVPGLLSSGKGRDFLSLIRALDQCGYSVAWRVFESAGFGLPLSRSRLFLVGRLGDDFESPARVLALPESAGCDPDEDGARRRTPQDQEGAGDERGVLAFNLRGRAGGSRAEPSGLVTLRAGSGGSSWSYVIQDGAMRRLTPEEGERAMGFPAGFTAAPGVSQTARRRLIGNSIPIPPLAEILGRLQTEDAAA